MTQFEAGKTYRTDSGTTAQVLNDHGQELNLPLRIMIKGDVHWAGHDGVYRHGTLLPGAIEDEKPIAAAVTAIENVTPDRLSVVESSLRDVHRQLRTIRGNQSELLADMAAKLEQIVERLDGTDRRVEAINEGLKDAGDLLLKHEDRIITIDLRRVHSRINRHAERMTDIEASLARIEDMLTAEKSFNMLDRVRKLESQTYEQQKKLSFFVSNTDSTPIKDGSGALEGCNCDECMNERLRAKPARKSIGWVNVFVVTDPTSIIARGGPRINGPFASKDEAMKYRDDRPIQRHVACVEIFEGDGL